MISSGAVAGFIGAHGLFLALLTFRSILARFTGV